MNGCLIKYRLQKHLLVMSLE